MTFAGGASDENAVYHLCDRSVLATQAFAAEVTDCPHIVWKNGHHVCSIVEKRSVATRQAPCEEICLITVPELAAEALGSYLAEQLNRRFGSTDIGLRELIPSLSRLALDCIGNSDALYHNVEHTMLVTLVGHEIMSGRALLMPTSASDYAHVVAACLFHDIGYVRGILKQDGADEYVTDSSGGKTALARGSSDAALMPYHVDRSKLFVMDRIAKSKLLDAVRITSAIECTRFPVAHDAEKDNEEGLLVRAADLIGQLGDPQYLRKANALYYEFEEVGMNRQLGYTSPADLTNQYPQFYWSSVSVQIQPALRYLNVTSSGRQWMATLYSNVFRAERELNLSGLQREQLSSTVRDGGVSRRYGCKNRPERTTAPMA